MIVNNLLNILRHYLGSLKRLKNHFDNLMLMFKTLDIV